jgi:hypothetical protein
MSVLLSRISIERSFDKGAIDVTVRAKIPFVSPEWKHVLDHRDGKETDEEYTKWYRARLTAGRNIIHKWIQQFPGESLIFMCWCKDGEFCHTYLLIDWLVENWPDEFRKE